MKRVAIVVPDDLEAQINAHLSGQEARPSLGTLAQVDLPSTLGGGHVKAK